MMFLSNILTPTYYVALIQNVKRVLSPILIWSTYQIATLMSLPFTAVSSVFIVPGGE